MHGKFDLKEGMSFCFNYFSVFEGDKVWEVFWYVMLVANSKFITSTETTDNIFL